VQYDRCNAVLRSTLFDNCARVQQNEIMLNYLTITIDACGIQMIETETQNRLTPQHIHTENYNHNSTFIQ